MIRITCKCSWIPEIWCVRTTSGRRKIKSRTPGPSANRKIVLYNQDELVLQQIIKKMSLISKTNKKKIVFDVKHGQEAQLIDTQFMTDKQKAELVPERCTIFPKERVCDAFRGQKRSDDTRSGRYFAGVMW